MGIFGVELAGGSSVLPCRVVGGILAWRKKKRKRDGGGGRGEGLNRCGRCADHRARSPGTAQPDGRWADEEGAGDLAGGDGGQWLPKRAR